MPEALPTNQVFDAFNGWGSANDVLFGAGALIIVFFVFILIAIIGFFFFWRSKFTFKVGYRPLRGDIIVHKTKDEDGKIRSKYEIRGTVSVGNRSTTRFGWDKHKLMMRAMHPWFNKNDFAPIPQECIVGQNEIECYKLPDGTWIPQQHLVISDGNEILAKVGVVPAEAKKWFEIKAKQIAQDYDDRTKLDMFKPMLAFGGILLAAVVVIGILTYGSFSSSKYMADKAVEAGNNAAQAGTAQAVVCQNSIEELVKLISNQRVNASVYGGRGLSPPPQ